MMIAAFAAACFFSATFGDQIAMGAPVEMRDSHDGYWTIEIWCGPEKRPRDKNGQLSRQFIGMLYVDPKVKDPRNGRLLIDELKKAVKSRRFMEIRFQRNKGYGVITVIHSERPGEQLEIEDEPPRRKDR